jgi:hypothetical protein
MQLSNYNRTLAKDALIVDNRDELNRPGRDNPNGAYGISPMA